MVEPTIKYVLEAYVNGELIGKATSSDVNDVVSESENLSDRAEAKLEALLVEEYGGTFPLYRESL